jgi:hypothetical protein
LRVTGLLAACLLMPVKPVIRPLAFLAVSFTLWSLKDAILGNVSILLVLPLVVAWRWMDRPLGSVALLAGQPRLAAAPSRGADPSGAQVSADRTVPL